MNTPYIGAATLSWLAYTIIGLYLLKHHSFRKGELNPEDHAFATLFGLFGALLWPFTWTALTIAYTAKQTFKKLEEENYL